MGTDENNYLVSVETRLPGADRASDASRGDYEKARLVASRVLGGLWRNVEPRHLEIT